MLVGIGEEVCDGSGATVETKVGDGFSEISPARFEIGLSGCSTRYNNNNTTAKAPRSSKAVTILMILTLLLSSASYFASSMVISLRRQAIHSSEF
jgi:hypothetical protein